MNSKQLLANLLVSEGKQKTKLHESLGLSGVKKSIEVAHNEMAGVNFKDFTPEQLKSLKRVKFKGGSYTKAIEQALLVQKNEEKKEAVKPTSQARRPTEPR